MLSFTETASAASGASNGRRSSERLIQCGRCKNQKPNSFPGKDSSEGLTIKTVSTRAEERGATQEEIIDIMKSGVPIPAKRGRTGSAKVFSYNQHRGRKCYEQKRVEVIYATESDVIVTVTVYVFYGKWES